MPVIWPRFKLLSPKIWTHIILTPKTHLQGLPYKYDIKLFLEHCTCCEKIPFFWQDIFFFTKKCSSHIWLHPLQILREFNVRPLVITSLLFWQSYGHSGQDYCYWLAAALALIVIKSECVPVSFQTQFMCTNFHSSQITFVEIALKTANVGPRTILMHVTNVWHQQ